MYSLGDPAYLNYTHLCDVHTMNFINGCVCTYYICNTNRWNFFDFSFILKINKSMLNSFTVFLKFCCKVIVRSQYFTL